MLARDVLAVNHTTNEIPVIKVEGVTTGLGKGKKDIENPQEAIESLKQGERVYISVMVEGSERNVVYTFSKSLGLIYWAYDDIEKIESEHKELLESFDKDSLDKFESLSEDVVYNIVKNAELVKSGAEINPDNYESISELEKDIYDTVISYKGIEEDVEKLNNLLNEVGETRKTIVQTSFS